MKLLPCKHLDYTEKYVGCTLRTCAPDYPDVRYWERQDQPWGVISEKVQFCSAGRGRINGIFQCYGEKPCWEKEER